MNTTTHWLQFTAFALLNLIFILKNSEIIEVHQWRTELVEVAYIGEYFSTNIYEMLFIASIKRK